MKAGEARDIFKKIDPDEQYFIYKLEPCQLTAREKIAILKIKDANVKSSADPSEDSTMSMYFSLDDGGTSYEELTGTCEAYEKCDPLVKGIFSNGISKERQNMLVQGLLTVIDAVTLLETHGYFLNDLHPGNIVIDFKTGRVRIVDCLQNISPIVTGKEAYQSLRYLFTLLSLRPYTTLPGDFYSDDGNISKLREKLININFASIK
jgi:hypothetical protein